MRHSESTFPAVGDAAGLETCATAPGFMDGLNDFEIAHPGLKPGRDAVAAPLAISRVLADRRVGPSRFVESPHSIFFACIRIMNRCLRSSLRAVGRQFPLSRRERAGVRENRSNKNVMRLMERFLLILIQLYRWIFSPAQVFLFGGGSGCRFTPTCSQYAAEAIRHHGALAGSALAFKRICRCHPLGGCGHDPVPEEPLISNG